MNKKRILFLGAGPAITQSIGFQDKYIKFSRFYSGDIITPVDGIENMAIRQIGNFTVHPFLYYSGSSLMRNLIAFFNTLRCALQVYHSEKPFHAVISPNPLLTGITALLIAKLTKAKCIIEVNGNFESAFKYGRMGESTPELAERVKDRLSKVIIVCVLKLADMVKLVYDNQLKSLHIKEEERIVKRSFPNYVPIQKFIEHPKTDGRYILLLGYPWYLKGVDILIKAFQKISPDYPDLKLKVVGWCPEGRDYFESLAAGNSNIELCDPVYYEAVIPLMTNCTMYVLASRTDSSPRVLREAMAAEKPIIASNIDGVPDLIHDGYNGLLFEKENTDDLAQKMLKILKNQELARELSANGLVYVQEHLSEDCYLKNYKCLIEETLAS